MGHGAQKHGSTPHGSKGLVVPPPPPFPVVEQGQTGEGDVLLYQTNDDGEINYTGGLVEMHGGLRTSAYLSLFGGNEEDDGRLENELTWWGNLGENDPSKKYISRTQHLLKSLVATTENLNIIESAALLDLEWMLNNGVATEITISASIPGFNKIKISGSINADGDKFTFEFIENWRSF